MRISPLWLALATVSIALAGSAGGYWYATRTLSAAVNGAGGASAAKAERKPLYWYDPMSPGQRFDKPGKSPFMDMELVPKYADEGDETGGTRIDARVLQNLGVRYATVERGSISAPLDVVASVVFNERDVAIVQARSAGFVERVHARAPGDLVARGAPIADVLVPDWAALQSEFLGILKSGDLDLVAATRERLKVSGMPEALIAQVERSGATHPVFTVSAPLGGVIQTLDVRAGMTLAQGMTLARINGLETVWVEAALPELQAGLVRPGQPVEVRLAAYPGEVARGRVIAILPEANAESRTLRVRAELPNREARYRPGMFAQVRFAAGESASVLFVPSEAVIRTGRRDMVLAVGDDGAFHPVEVRTGREGDGRTAILGGLAEGQKVVASGQFLIDSEASLRGALPRLGEPAGATSTPDTSHGNPKAGKP